MRGKKGLARKLAEIMKSMLAAGILAALLTAPVDERLYVFITENSEAARTQVVSHFHACEGDWD